MKDENHFFKSAYILFVLLIILTATLTTRENTLIEWKMVNVVFITTNGDLMVEVVVM